MCIKIIDENMAIVVQLYCPFKLVSFVCRLTFKEGEKWKDGSIIDCITLIKFVLKVQSYSGQEVKSAVVMQQLPTTASQINTEN